MTERNLHRRVDALERRAEVRPLSRWETVIVNQADGDTREAAMARHFDGDGATLGARLVVVTIQEAE